MHAPQPKGPILPGWFHQKFQLTSDATRTPILVANDVVRLYMGYRLKCQFERTVPQEFSTWLGTPSSTSSGNSEHEAI